MTTKQENKITMWIIVNTFLINNDAIWSALLAISSCVTRFRDALLASAQFATAQTITTLGVTIDKATAATQAIAEGVRISGIIQAYATDISNSTLFKDLAFTKSKLDKLADTNIAIKLRFIHTAATNLITPLDSYGIDASQLDAFNVLINIYETTIPLPRARTITIKSATTNLSSIITLGTKELKTLDKLMGNFITTHPQFYQDYISAREIIDLGTTSTNLKIQVIDATTNTFIPTATITNSLNDQQFITNSKGKATGKIKFGTYNFTAAATGYQSKTLLEEKVKLGQTHTLNFTLTKA